MMLLVKSVSHASSCPLRCRSCVCWLYLRHNILRKNIWVIYPQHIAYLQPVYTYMCGKERERFLEIPSPDFTSLRSSPSGFADKVASVSESFGRVSECKVTKKKIALQKKSRKSYCFSVAVFRKLKMAIIAMIFCSGSLTHFVTGIVSHFCNCYMLQLC